MPPGVLHGLGGAAGFQQLTSGHVHFSSRCWLTTVLSSAVPSRHARRASAWRPRAAGPPSAAPQACALGSWVHLTARGLVRISRRWLQMSCEQQQLGVLLLRGEAVRAPPAEKPTFRRPIGSPGFTLSHPGPHDAVAFTQRVLLACRAPPGQQPSEPEVSTAVRGGRAPRTVKNTLGFKRCPGRELAHILWGALLGKEVCFPKPESCCASALCPSNDLALLSEGAHGHGQREPAGF